MAQHIAQIFKRSPIPVYEKELEQFETSKSPCKQKVSEEEQKQEEKCCSELKSTDDKTSCSSQKECSDKDKEMWIQKLSTMNQIVGNSHFENLQSTNWNSLRFKNPPTVDSNIGWRVEFRPMDI